MRSPSIIGYHLKLFVQQVSKIAPIKLAPCNVLIHTYFRKVEGFSGYGITLLFNFSLLIKINYLFALVFGRAWDEMGKKANIWPKMHILDQFGLFLGQKS